MSSPSPVTSLTEQVGHQLDNLNLTPNQHQTQPRQTSSDPTTPLSAIPSPSPSPSPTQPPTGPASSASGGLSSSGVGPPPVSRPTVSQSSHPASAPNVPLASGAVSGSGGPPRRPPGAGGALRQGVRGNPNTGSAGGIRMPPSLAAKMAAMASRSSSGTPSSQGGSTPRIPTLSSAASTPAVPPRNPAPTPGAVPPPVMPRPGAPPRQSAPAGGMAARRKLGGPGLTLSAMKAPAPSFNGNGSSAGDGENDSAGGFDGPRASPGAMSPGRDEGGTPFANFSKIVDPSGRLNFASKAVVHADGVDFSSGASFKIKMDDFELFEELGKGNYGTVQKVWHKPTKVTMALKEIRLELDDSKLKTIITELDILHRATSPYIIDFYGAFFIESCVYYCMEYMDGGSLEVVAGCDVSEDVLATVTRSVVHGLKFLKDDLKIMHRDVKPTNVLISRSGAVKLCDFGVSGQLDRSLAKTVIGCQSYMAPERIKGETTGTTVSYTAASDVWSLGLSIIEFALGRYPYPPETYQNVFAQLTAIVHGDPPALPAVGQADLSLTPEQAKARQEGEKCPGYSEVARDFVSLCLIKNPRERPSYGELLEHPFLAVDPNKKVDMAGWIAGALEFRDKHPRVVPVLA